jgi:adenine-specific DNA-methyltransferase
VESTKDRATHRLLPPPDGQQHDVVVVNFLNRRNQADERVFELLSEEVQFVQRCLWCHAIKFSVHWSPVSISNGESLPFTRPCRTPEQIAMAFDQLQSELDGEIQTRLESTRQVLLGKL